MKYIIEHMEDGFTDWVQLEYLAIAKDVSGENLFLTSTKPGLEIPAEFKEAGITATTVDVSEFGRLDPEFTADQVCLLDPSAEQDLAPSDAKTFKYFLFGGILGDHPPRDRTGELRKYGFVGRRLGSVQMTTDTAVRVTQLVLKDQQPLEKIPFVDFPELEFNKNESTEMPFRYVTDANGKPILPAGMFELIMKDSERGFDF